MYSKQLTRKKFTSTSGDNPSMSGTGGSNKDIVNEDLNHSSLRETLRMHSR